MIRRRYIRGHPNAASRAQSLAVLASINTPPPQPRTLPPGAKCQIFSALGEYLSESND